MVWRLFGLEVVIVAVAVLSVVLAVLLAVAVLVVIVASVFWTWRIRKVSANKQTNKQKWTKQRLNTSVFGNTAV